MPERINRLSETQWFAGYELEELVHENQLGRVYKARDVRLRRTVALRIISPELTNDPVTRARLNRESTAIAEVDHPNLLPIYEVGEDEGRLFIVSRWVDGSSLGTLVQRDGPLEPRRAVRVVNQVARALRATHEHGILHRNIRPSSILVTPSEQVYLTDFEYARFLTDATLLVLGSQLAEEVDYVAPEYIAGETVDGRADIYGLGGVLYYALTGEVPFPGATVAAKVYAHRFSEPPSARALRPEVPGALDAVIARAMAKDPAERQQSADQFALDAAGAVALSAPLWATRRRSIGPGGAHLESDDDARERAGPIADRAVETRSPTEPALYSSRGRRLRHWLMWAVLLLVFVAAPIALLLTVG
jgi:serine/threonine protein kinase